MIVAPVTLEDLDAVARMVRDMVEEAPRYFPPLDSARARATVEMAIAHPETVRISVAMTDTEYAGFVFAMLTDYPYSPDARAVIDTIYTTPKHRAGMAGPKLMKDALDWIGQVRPVILGESAGIDPKGFARFVGRFGFEPSGTIYRLENP